MSDDPFKARAGERETLVGALEWQRVVAAGKVAELDREQATRIMTPTGLSILGVLRHLALVERKWFRQTFAGEDVEVVASEGPSTSRAPQFEITETDTVASITALYEDETARSRRILEEADSLERHSARDSGLFGLVSLRWILVHMIEETARHNGHLDLMREQLDGRIGD